MAQIEDLRRMYSIRDVLGVGERVRWMVCPLPGHPHGPNPTPSFSIYIGDYGDERFKCHGVCGASGDVIDLVGYLEIPGYDPRKDVHEAANLLDVNYQANISIATTQPRVEIDPRQWERYLPPSERIVKYAKTRGLTPETLAKFRIGSDRSFMTMPTFEDGELKGIKLRNTLTKAEIDDPNLDSFMKLRFTQVKGSRRSVFNIDSVAWKPDPILIVKGEIPAMLLDQLGFLACAPNSGEGMRAANWFPKLMISSRRVVVGDNDPDPIIAERTRWLAERRADELLADLVFPPGPYKDVDEFILVDPRAIEIIKGWLA